MQTVRRHRHLQALRVRLKIQACPLLPVTVVIENDCTGSLGFREGGMTCPRLSLARILPLLSLYTPKFGLKTLSNDLLSDWKRFLSSVVRRLSGSVDMVLENGTLEFDVVFGGVQVGTFDLIGSADGVVTLRIVAICWDLETSTG